MPGACQPLFVPAEEAGGDGRARPLVGLSAYRERAKWGAWDQDAVLVPWAYIDAVDAAGGHQLVLPPVDQGADEVVNALSALVLVGGADLDPASYGQRREGATAAVRPDRDRAEFRLLTAALDRQIPVLGICRGAQLLNVAFGGDLIQDLPTSLSHDRHSETPGRFSNHLVRLDSESQIGSILGPACRVASYHHQGIGRIAPCFRAAAWAEDQTVEAIELPGATAVWGVLWHAEAGDSNIFAALVAEASRTNDGRERGVADARNH